MNFTAVRPPLPHSTSMLVGAISFALVLTGCTLCQNCGDLDYPTYGGAWERTRRDSGRVGSIFDPAGARSATLSDRDSDSNDASIRGSDESTDSSNPKMDNDENNAAEDKDSSKDPKGSDIDPSPSDKPRDKDRPSLRQLDLEDINFDSRDVLPPDV